MESSKLQYNTSFSEYEDENVSENKQHEHTMHAPIYIHVLDEISVSELFHTLPHVLHNF